MVQSILFFVLGFLCAAFVVLLIAPAVWRRAVTLTRQRIEASVPLTRSEIQAERDGLRAEFAMSVRKLEMDVKAFREKSAGQAVELGRSHEALNALEARCTAQDQKLAGLSSENEALKGELAEREARLRQLSEKYAAGQRAAVEQSRELDRLGQMYDEASFSASNRQIELVSREAELEKLSGNLLALRRENKLLAQRGQEMDMQGKRADTALSTEKKKVAELDKKLQRMMSTLADRDDRLDRREKELARLRGQAKTTAGRLPKQRNDTDEAIARVDADRARLEEELTVLARENKKRKAGRTGTGPSKPDAGVVAAADAALLREQMHDLAAEVVSLTARLEGQDSPIARLLAEPGKRQPPGEGRAQMPALADRIKALQKAAVTG